MRSAISRAVAFRSHNTARSTAVSRSRSENSDGDDVDVILHIYHRHFRGGQVRVAEPQRVCDRSFSIPVNQSVSFAIVVDFKGVSAQAPSADRVARVKTRQDLFT